MNKIILEDYINRYIFIKLKDKYPDKKFKISNNREGFFRIIYNDEELDKDKYFFDFVYELCWNILREEDLDRLSVVYDIYNEIN